MVDVACGKLGDVMVFVTAGGSSLGGGGARSLGNDVYSARAYDIL